VLPRSRILGGAATIGDLAARPLLGGDGEVRRLLAGHVNNLLNTRDLLDPRLANLASDYLAGLVGALLGHNREVQRESALRAVPAARLAAVRTSLRRRFREPGLTAESVGANLGLSARYVQHLMQQDGSTFTGELMAMRLEAAHAELIAEPLNGASVTDIAFRCGFSDLSTFYRAFRARFGQTPNAVRGSGARG
jgi:AraC-like DNA-binding protein